jgi:hypothetical protein
MAKYAEGLNMEAAASYFFLIYAVVVFLSRPLYRKSFRYAGRKPGDLPGHRILCRGAGRARVYKRTVDAFACGRVDRRGVRQHSFHRSGHVAEICAARLFCTRLIHVLRVLDCGLGFGPYFYGFIVPTLGYGGLFKATAAIVAVAIPIYYFVHGKKAAHPSAWTLCR